MFFFLHVILPFWRQNTPFLPAGFVHDKGRYHSRTCGNGWPGMLSMLLRQLPSFFAIVHLDPHFSTQPAHLCGEDEFP
jgi:hypothetical protein